MMLHNNKNKLAVLLTGLLASITAQATDNKDQSQQAIPGFYRLVLNGQDAQREDLVQFFVVGTDYYMKRQDADAYGLLYGAKDTAIIKGQPVVKLNNLGILREEGSDLVLHANAQNMRALNYNFQNNIVTAPRAYTNSAFMNYSLSYDSQSQATGINTSFYKSFDNGVLYNLNTNYSSIDKRHPYTILDAYREQYFNDKLTTLRIGSSYTGYNSLINPASFVGIQYKKDFSLDGNYIKNPLLNIAGTADAKSIAELYVNGQNFGSVPVNQGSFNFQNIGSGQSSANNVQVVVKDINGNVTNIQNVSLVGAPFNLRKGVSDYSFEAGKFRLGYNQFGPAFASGTYSYGLTDQFTLEGHVEASSQQKRASVNATYATNFGTFQYGIAKGVTSGKSEQLQKFQYNYQRGDFYTNLAIVRANNFHTFGNTQNYIPNQEIATIGYRILNTNISFSEVKYGSAERRETLAFSKYIGRTNVSLQLNKQGNNKGVFVMFNIPLDGKNEWRSNSSFTSDKYGSSTDLNVNRYGGYNDWNMNADLVKNSTGNNTASGTFQYNSQYGTATLYGYNNKSTTDINAKLEGALVFDNGIHTSRQIFQGYALVDAGAKDIPISLNNLDVAKTGSDGMVVIPNVYSNVDNKVSIQAENLPANIQVDDGAVNVAAHNYFKVDVNFKVKKNPVILQPSIDMKGIESVEIGGKTFYTTPKGIYFDDYKPETEYTAQVKECKLRFKIKEQVKLNEVIPLNCEK